jgi:hypothetical protein
MTNVWPVSFHLSLYTLLKGGERKERGKQQRYKHKEEKGKVFSSTAYSLYRSTFSGLAKLAGGANLEVQAIDRPPFKLWDHHPLLDSHSFRFAADAEVLHRVLLAAASTR